MGWKISPPVAAILESGGEGGGIDRSQALMLMALPTRSRETYALMETANRLSRELFGEKGENHFHIGVNVAPCPLNCLFCSLTQRAGIFKAAVDFSAAQILDWAEHAQAHGADALNLMTTGTFAFKRLLEIGRMLKKAVGVPLVANTRDINHKEGEALVEAGFVGAYHAVRLGEGRDTPLNREKRIHTIHVLRDVGLRWMNCVEPGTQPRRDRGPDAAGTPPWSHLQRHHAAHQLSGLAHDEIRYDQRARNGENGGRLPAGHGLDPQSPLHP